MFYKSVSLKNSTSPMNIEISTSYKIGKYWLFSWKVWTWKKLFSLGRSGSWRHPSLFHVLWKWDVFKQRRTRWLCMSNRGKYQQSFLVLLSCLIASSETSICRRKSLNSPALSRGQPWNEHWYDVRTSHTQLPRHHLYFIDIYGDIKGVYICGTFWSPSPQIRCGSTLSQ